jgi:holo-[acyl-carrier protein] synthase
MVEISRVERLIASKGEHALKKLFTDAERAYAMSRPRPGLHFAARVAAKEATYKALRGTHEARAIGWRELEVVVEWDGAPTLLLHGGAAKRAVELGVTRVHISLTHTAGSAAAVAVLEGPGSAPESENYTSAGAQK